tara:strand:- start:211 stop:342 length:132 start_codon:yes stop_codon:yes gene_type:complete
MVHLGNRCQESKNLKVYKTRRSWRKIADIYGVSPTAISWLSMT